VLKTDLIHLKAITFISLPIIIFLMLVYYVKIFIYQ